MTVTRKQRAMLLQQEMEGTPEAENTNKEPSRSHINFYFIHTLIDVTHTITRTCALQ